MVKISALPTKTAPQSDDMLLIVDNTGGDSKRISKRNLVTDVVTAVTSTGSLTINADTTDIQRVTALAEALTINEPSGTPIDGQRLVLSIKDNGTPRALNWNAIFKAIGANIPTTTIANKQLYIGMLYNSYDSKWHVVSISGEL